MKAGIITYHFSKNYGAVLQCYALQTELQRQGIDAHVLNYVSSKQQDNNALYSKKYSPRSLLKNVMLLPFHFSRKRKYDAFDSFLSKYLMLTKQVSSLQELKELTDDGYNVLISGSDQVFNPSIDDFEEAFLFPFETAARKTSFAASMGRADDSALQKYREYLADFSCLTVRESNAVPFLNKLQLTVDAVVADPVFLLSRQQWQLLLHNGRKIPKKPYVFCYFLDAQHTADYLKTAKRIAQERGLKLVNLVTRFRASCFSEGAVINADPEEFLQLLANADYVCTDSFHGTAFSVLMNIDFSSLVPSANGLDQRKQNLAKRVGLENRIVYADRQNIDSSKIDFSNVNACVEEIRNNSRGILTDLLQIHEDSL